MTFIDIVELHKILIIIRFYNTSFTFFKTILITLRFRMSILMHPTHTRFSQDIGIYHVVYQNNIYYQI